MLHTEFHSIGMEGGAWMGAPNAGDINVAFGLLNEWSTVEVRVGLYLSLNRNQ